MANPTRVSVNPHTLALYDFKAYSAFCTGGFDLAETMDDSDLALFTYDGEYYTESHDEQTCHVYRGGRLVSVPWSDRPR